MTDTPETLLILENRDKKNTRSTINTESVIRERFSIKSYSELNTALTNEMTR